MRIPLCESIRYYPFKRERKGEAVKTIAQLCAARSAKFKLTAQNLKVSRFCDPNIAFPSHAYTLRQSIKYHPFRRERKGEAVKTIAQLCAAPSAKFKLAAQNLKVSRFCDPTSPFRMRYPLSIYQILSI
jgi:hypothetical protein